MFGLKGDVTNNCFFLDANTVIYPCGHNVVIFNKEDKTQRYIPGVEGSEGITAMALSPSKRYLAVCEKAAKAVCSIYNLAKFIEISKERKMQVFDQSKSKKWIVSSADYDASKFVSADFSGLNEKLLVTLTSEPDYKIIVWQWDKKKCISNTPLGIMQPAEPRHISFSNSDPNNILVTGRDVFKFYKLENF
jgi:cilia- and flagella-associated protein 57